METHYEGSFLDWLRQRPGPLSLQEVAHFIYQAASALQDAHNHHIIYQNITPACFYIRRNKQFPGLPNLQLADLERSPLTGGISTSGQSISSPPTSTAPEQWEGLAGLATAQYALAIMAYQLLTWPFPFQGTQEHLLHQDFYVEPPSTLNARIPPAVDIVLLRALAKRPEDRYPCITAFANAFQQALQVPNGISTPHIPSSPGVGTPYHGFTRDNAFNFRNARTVNEDLSSSNQLKELLLLGAVFLIVVSSIGFGFFSILKNQQNTLSQTKNGPQALASTVTSGAPIFADNLGSNTNGRWSEGPLCAFTGGTYHILVPHTNYFQACGLAKEPVFDDAAIQVDVSLLTADVAGMIFRFDQGKFYDCEITKASEVFCLRNQLGTKSIFLMNKTKTNAIALGNQKNRLLVIAKRNNFKLYINDVFVGEVQDGTYARGLVGFIARTVAPTPTGEASFSNFKVFKL